MLVIQDPSDPDAPCLLESLLDAFRSANRIIGAFSFASAAGVRRLTGDDSFKEAARYYPVELVVGVDAVTDTRALDSLATISDEFSNFDVKVFLNRRPGASTIQNSVGHRPRVVVA